MPPKKHPILIVALVFAALAAPAFVLSQSLQTTCTVSSVNAVSGIVRAEPGNFGSPVTFLVRDREYPVTGHTTMPDGTEWWSLDQTAFLTRNLESDPWVSTAEVSPSGDCDTFADSTSEETSSTAAPTPTGGRSIISVRATLRAGLGTGSSSYIREGLWQLTLTNVAMNCGDGSVYLGPQEADNLISIDPSDMPDSLLFDGSVLQSDASGTYDGQFDLPLVGRLFDADITLTIVSDTVMTGTLVAHLGNCDYESEVELNHAMDLDD